MFYISFQMFLYSSYSIVLEAQAGVHLFLKVYLFR